MHRSHVWLHAALPQAVTHFASCNYSTRERDKNCKSQRLDIYIVLSNCMLQNADESINNRETVDKDIGPDGSFMGFCPCEACYIRVEAAITELSLGNNVNNNCKDRTSSASFGSGVMNCTEGANQQSSTGVDRGLRCSQSGLSDTAHSNGWVPCPFNPFMLSCPSKQHKQTQIAWLAVSVAWLAVCSTLTVAWLAHCSSYHRLK